MMGEIKEMVETRSKPRTIILWVLRIVLSLAFLAAGGSKLAGISAMVAVFAKIGIGQWFRVLTGLLEVLGAFGLLISPVTSYASALLSLVMLSAIGFHLSVLGGNPTAPIVLFVLLTVTFVLSRKQAKTGR